MTFKDDLNSDLTDTFYSAENDEFIEDIVYNTVAGVAIIDRLGALDISGEKSAQVAQMRIQKSFVQKPVYQDEVVFDGLTWRVQKNVMSDGYEWIIELWTDESYTVHR